MTTGLSDLLTEVQDKVTQYQNTRVEYDQTAEELERSLMRYLFDLHQQRIISVNRIADLLGVSRQTVYNRWKIFDIRGTTLERQENSCSSR